MIYNIIIHFKVKKKKKKKKTFFLDKHSWFGRSKFFPSQYQFPWTAFRFFLIFIFLGAILVLFVLIPNSMVFYRHLLAKELYAKCVTQKIGTHKSIKPQKIKTNFTRDIVPM